MVTHAEQLGGQAQPEALRRSIPGFTGGLLVYVAGTLIAAFGLPLAALIIYGLLGGLLPVRAPAQPVIRPRPVTPVILAEALRPGPGPVEIPGCEPESARAGQVAGDSAGSQIRTRVP